MMKRRARLLTLLVAAGFSLTWAAAQERPVVLLDGYHNSEAMPHYRWDGTYHGGYSELGKVLQSLGADLRTVSDPITPEALIAVNCLIIVNPDSKAQIPNPNYIGKDEIAAIREWVRGGGLLVLLGNDRGHMEFQHFNELAREFGLKFIEKTHQNSSGGSKLTIPIAAGAHFGSGGTAYFVDVAPLEVTAPHAQSLISDNQETIASLVAFGEGRVLAIGDPWVYNEYIDTQDNRALVTALFRSLFRGAAPAARDLGKPVPFDGAGVRTGPVHLTSTADAVTVSWADERSRNWTATFSLIPRQPLITAIAVEGKTILSQATPIYRCQTGKRRGGWDEFFDNPFTHPDGIREFLGVFEAASASAQTVGNRLQIQFEGFKAGILQGAIRYTFYPGMRIIQQEAIVTTREPDTAMIYDGGLRMMKTSGDVSYYDTKGQLQTVPTSGAQWNPTAVRYRALAGGLAGGSIVAFPAPHQYFFPRDHTTNMGYLWHSRTGDWLSLGIRQLPDDNTAYYPWFSAPPGSELHLGVFFLLSDELPAQSLNEVLNFTHRDRFPALDGYKTFTNHWHFAYTMDAMQKGFDWVPPFKPVLKDMGVQAIALADFHGDGHPQDLTSLRLEELDAYFRACRTQSDNDFVMIPSEEANVHLGGHWVDIFPKPVYWFMGRPAGTPFVTRDPKYGTVYHAGDAEDLLKLFQAENALVYTSHPRSKGSKGFPDAYRRKDFYLDSHFYGGSWKEINVDLSSPRLGDRSFNLLDDMNNWGQPKKILGEVDVFKITSEDELYGHMNINYVRMDRLPDWNHYGDFLAPLERGDFFVTTGEVLLPEATIRPGPGGEIDVHARVRWTFPLRFAEVVWGDGRNTYNQTFSLENTGAFGESTFDWKVQAGNWKWARVAVWDVAADGAFVNPVKH